MRQKKHIESIKRQGNFIFPARTMQNQILPKSQQILRIISKKVALSVYILAALEIEVILMGLEEEICTAQQYSMIQI